MQPANVNGHPLQHECSAFPDRLISTLGKFIQELLLLAVDGTGRTGGLEILLEKNGITQRAILTLTGVDGRSAEGVSLLRFRVSSGSDFRNFLDAINEDLEHKLWVD